MCLLLSSRLLHLSRTKIIVTALIHNERKYFCFQTKRETKVEKFNNLFTEFKNFNMQILFKTESIEHEWLTFDLIETCRAAFRTFQTSWMKLSVKMFCWRSSIMAAFRSPKNASDLYTTLKCCRVHV